MALSDADLRALAERWVANPFGISVIAIQEVKELAAWALQLQQERDELRKRSEYWQYERKLMSDATEEAYQELTALREGLNEVSTAWKQTADDENTSIQIRTLEGPVSAAEQFYSNGIAWALRRCWSDIAALLEKKS